MKLNKSILIILIVTLSILNFDIQAQQITTPSNNTNIESLLRSIEAQARTQEVLLRTLIDEMRQNRLSTQLNSINLYRLQTLTDNLNNQQIRVDGLTTEIDLLNEQMTQSNEPSSLEIELKALEEQIGQSSDPTQRVLLNKTLNNAKHSLENEKERLKREREQNRLRHQNLTLRLQAEKARLAEIEENISSMDRYFQNITNELVSKSKK
jgi:chromosome segregation ATPase